MVRKPVKNERRPAATAAAAATATLQQLPFVGIQTAGSLRWSWPSSSQSQTLRQDSSAGSFDPTTETRTSRFWNYVSMLQESGQLLPAEESSPPPLSLSLSPFSPPPPPATVKLSENESTFLPFDGVYRTSSFAENVSVYE